ncbi:MAG: DUF805 domain-containing protein [Psychrobacter sp.]|nr:DUF805 domain-containing protein [Psychrobacter sp.]
MTDQSSLNPNRPNLTKSGNIENIENFESNINHGVGIINDNPPNVVNPYSSPTAPLSHPQLNEGSSAVTNDSKWYQLSGRIGRLRYAAYVMLLSGLAYVVLMIFMAMLVSSSDLLNDGNILGLLMAAYLPLLPFMFYTAIIYPKRRLNDLDKSGWWLLLMFVPLVNIAFSLYLFFAPGTVGPNQFGAPPRPNRKIHYIGGLIVPFVGAAIIGILAAIAIPAYQNYIEQSMVASESEVQQWDETQ